MTTADFKIAPVSDTATVRILAYGDSRSDPEVQERIVTSAIEYNPDIALHSGDLVADGKRLLSVKENRNSKSMHVILFA